MSKKKWIPLKIFRIWYDAGRFINFVDIHDVSEEGARKYFNEHYNQKIQSVNEVDKKKGKK